MFTHCLVRENLGNGSTYACIKKELEGEKKEGENKESEKNLEGGQGKVVKEASPERAEGEGEEVKAALKTGEAGTDPGEVGEEADRKEGKAGAVLKEGKVEAIDPKGEAGVRLDQKEDKAGAGKDPQQSKKEENLQGEDMSEILDINVQDGKSCVIKFTVYVNQMLCTNTVKYC